MDDQPSGAISANRRDDHENAFEASARVVIQFVVRAAILPYTLLMATPRDLARAAATGHYRPLPSPFLLALTAGVIVSGAVSGVGVLLSDRKDWEVRINEYVALVAHFYAQRTDQIEAILYAVPYIFTLWLVSAMVSAFMLHGTRNAEAIFAAISLCLAALIEVFAVLFALVNFAPFARIPAVEFVLPAAVVLYAFALGWKLVRVLFLIRGPTGARRGTIAFAAAPCLLLVAALTLTGAGAIWAMTLMQREVNEKKAQLVSQPVQAGGVLTAPLGNVEAPQTDKNEGNLGDVRSDRANPTPVIVNPAFRR